MKLILLFGILIPYFDDFDSPFETFEVNIHDSEINSRVPFQFSHLTLLPPHGRFFLLIDSLSLSLSLSLSPLATSNNISAYGAYNITRYEI